MQQWAALQGVHPDGTVVHVAVRLAAVQGAIWFILLSHGGNGLAFGPMAWIAMLLAGRVPPVAAALLLAPALWLAASWTPILEAGTSPTNWLIVASLIVPALGAAAMLLLPGWTRVTQMRRAETIERGRT